MAGRIFKIVLLLIIAALVFLWLIKASLASSFLTDKMKVPVSLRSLAISPSEMLIEEFKIRNPRGFKMKDALKAEEIQVKYGWKKLFHNPSEIDVIEVKDIFLDVELSNATGTQNNWTAIGANIPSSDKPARELIIHKLILSNLTAEIRGVGGSQTPIVRKLDRLELDEIDSREGFPTKQLISAIFKGVGMEMYIKELINPQNIIKKALSPLRLGAENEEVK
ncbi:MAG TPA: hypothetical protein VGM34_02855 [Chlamydiales bacterium]